MVLIPNQSTIFVGSAARRMPGRRFPRIDYTYKQASMVDKFFNDLRLKCLINVAITGNSRAISAVRFIDSLDNFVEKLVLIKCIASKKITFALKARFK